MQRIFSIMPDFLRNPEAFFRSIQKEKDLRSTVFMLALVSTLAFMAYGLSIGIAKSPMQAVSSALKVPLLFLATMGFCLPALHFFSLALLRTPLKLIQVFTVVLAGIGVTAFLLLGLAPVALFFALTSTNYEFFQLLAVAFVGVSACIGVSFLWRGMTMVESVRDNAARALGRRILFLWILLYGFVGTQMTWRLSPFIGRPEDPFYVVRPSRDNFYVDVVHAIEGALHLPASEAAWTTPLILGGLCALGLGVSVFAGGILVGNLTGKRGPGNESPASVEALPGAR
jgi:hypothetical protein